MKRNAGSKRRFPPAAPGMMDPDEWEAEQVIRALTGPPPAPVWPDRGPGPFMFRSGITRRKSYCPPCDLVLRGASACPRCHGEAVQLGTAWRPGRKGSRTRLWDHRQMRGYGQAVPEIIRQLGVPDRQPPRAPHWWRLNADEEGVQRRAVRQRARRRRNRER